MICPECGAETGESNRCANCDAEIGTATTAESDLQLEDSTWFETEARDWSDPENELSIVDSEEVRKASAKRTGILVGIIVAAIAVIAVIVVGALGSTGPAPGSSSAAQGENSASSADAASESSSSASSPSPSSAQNSGSGASTAASSASSAAVAAAFDPACLDPQGNVTLYALVELDGSELQTLLSANDFAWSDDASVWISKQGGMLCAVNGGGNLSQRDIDKLGVGAAESPIVYLLTVKGPATPTDALASAAANVVIVDEFDDGDALFAIVTGSTGWQYLAVVTSTGDNEQAILLYTEQAIAQGLFRDTVGTDAGTTIPEVWKTITGKTTAAATEESAESEIVEVTETSETSEAGE